MKLIIPIVLVLFLFQFESSADPGKDEIESRKSRAIEQCKIDPMDPKCEKLLDAQYRRLKDSEKEYKEDKEERYFEQKTKKQANSELRACCRTTPDSNRCKALKSK
jgi:hypothetical protein